MSLAEPPPKMMTAEELMALPDDGVEREIIRGELRERSMTRRNRRHSGTEARIARLLGNWLETQPEPQGMIHSGEAGFRLRSEPETFVGIDVAYASAGLMAATDESVPFYDGPPVLAVEILSPTDQHGDIVEKVQLYLEVDTVVWVVDPDFRIITVHRPGREPETLGIADELDGNSYLPGFRIAVARLFGR